MTIFFFVVRSCLFLPITSTTIYPVCVLTVNMYFRHHRQKNPDMVARATNATKSRSVMVEDIEAGMYLLENDIQ